MLNVFITIILSLATSLASLFVYHRLVAQPSQVVGLVDVAEVFQAQQQVSVKQLVEAKDDAQREDIRRRSEAFAARFSQVLNALPQHCKCLVASSGSIVSSPGRTIDLTAEFRTQLGLPPLQRQASVNLPAAAIVPTSTSDVTGR